MNNYQIRPIEQGDHKQVTSLLQELSVFSPVDDALEAIWGRFMTQGNVLALVAVEEDGQVIIGYGSLCVETKIRGGAMGHIEDVVVAPQYQGRGIGRSIVEGLIRLAQLKGCYKVSLECREEKKNFYARLGFDHSGCAMSLMLASKK